MVFCIKPVIKWPIYKSVLPAESSTYFEDEIQAKAYLIYLIQITEMTQKA